MRSSISKETGQVICLVSEVCQEKLEGSISDKLMNRDALIKLISNANKILSEVGHQCVCSLIENVKSAKFIQKLYDEINSKNISLRSKCALYMDLILKNYPTNILEKNTAIIEPMIEKLVCDANKETRNSARQAFYEYQSLFPNKANKLFSKFDNATQKVLNEEQSAKERPKSNNNLLYSSQQPSKKEEVFNENYNMPAENFSKTLGFPSKTFSKTPNKKGKDSDLKKNQGAAHRTANSSTAINGGDDDDNSSYNRDVNMEENAENYKNMKPEKVYEKKITSNSTINAKKPIIPHNNERKTNDKISIDKNSNEKNNYLKPNSMNSTNSSNNNNLKTNSITITNNNNASNISNYSNNNNNSSKNRTYNEINKKKYQEEETQNEEPVEYEEKKKIVTSQQEIKKKILSNLNEKQKNESFHKKQEKDNNDDDNEEEVVEKIEKITKDYQKKEEFKTNHEDFDDIITIKEEELNDLLEKAENPVINY